MTQNKMENSPSLKTYFDTPEREKLSEVKKVNQLFEKESLLTQVLEGFPEMVYVLNEQRQIVAWNSRSFELDNEGEKNIIGKRFGEMINCIHSEEEEAGCGTSKFCAECGAAKAIKFTNEVRKQKFEECRITANVKGIEVSYDFLIHTTPLNFADHKFTIYALKNIENEKRRFALEKIFFHDVLNTSGAVNGLANMLKDDLDEDEIESIYDALIDSSSQLLNEITSQRELRSAEEGTLQLILKEQSVNTILKNSYNIYSKHKLSEGKYFTVEYLEKDIIFKSDATILIRSIGNLIKNAIEASGIGGKISLSAEVKNNSINFNIYNNKIIPDNIQLQIFQRSFSTKDKVGRGIGTYSVKLLVEQYLGGKVSFISNDKVDTIFTISIPI